MDKKVIEELVNKNWSTYQIADFLSCSPTNIRYWLKKYDLKTNTKIRRRYLL